MQLSISNPLTAGLWTGSGSDQQTVELQQPILRPRLMTFMGVSMARVGYPKMDTNMDEIGVPLFQENPQMDGLWWLLIPYHGIWWYMMAYDGLWWLLMGYDGLWCLEALKPGASRLPSKLHQSLMFLAVAWNWTRHHKHTSPAPLIRDESGLRTLIATRIH